MTINSPRAMLERLAFGFYLALIVGSCGLTGLGLIFGLVHGEVRPVCLGVAGLLLFAVIRPIGYRHLHFRDWEESFEPADGGNVLALSPEQQARGRELDELLRELDALERKRAAGEPDVWAVNQARRAAAGLLAADPALREVFAAELADRPELGQ
jgi:hypothetical protein